MSRSHGSQPGPPMAQYASCPTSKGDFDDLVKLSDEFNATICKFPLESNLLKTIGNKGGHDVKREIEEHAQGTRIIVHPKVVELAEKFLELKKSTGTNDEKAVFNNMDVDAFFTRMLLKRPMVFFTPRDYYILRDGKEGSGWPKTESTPDVSLHEYLSYDEICVSALFGVSVPTHFINSGTRHNFGDPGEADTFERKGIYTGLVGARFEKPDAMETQFMIVRANCTEERGYGAAAAVPSAWLKLWAWFYGVPHFPTLKEADMQQATSPGTYLKLRNGYLNIAVYKQRIRMIVEPFLRDANDRAALQQKHAYLHVVGLGLGVWMVDERQGKLMVDVYADVFHDTALPNISDIDFSFFPSDCKAMGDAGHEGTYKHHNGNRVKVHFSKRNPADPLNNPKKLLVAMYPWDGNSFPGNEYWQGQLGASGDPAAAACSTIGELQNPYINTHLDGRQRFTGHPH